MSADPPDQGRGDGPLSPPPDGPFAGLSVGQMLLMGLGMVMLAPGACALFFVFEVTREAWRGNPYAVTVLPVVIISLLVGAGGIWLIVAVRRSARRLPP